MMNCIRRVIAGGLCGAMLLSSAAMAVSCKKTPANDGGNQVDQTNYGQSAVTIDQLKVNETSNPVGIDSTPIFSWTPNSDGYGQYQTAYRVIVASTKEKAENNEGDLWDSGKVESPFCYSISYGGQALTSHTTYYWRVQAWDAENAKCDSAVSSFKTGVLSSNEWSGQWIGHSNEQYSISLTGASWIWYTGTNAGSTAYGRVPNTTQYFRCVFAANAAKQISKAILAVSADDQAVIYLNGTQIGEVSAWGSGVILDLTSYLKTANVLAAAVKNSGDGLASGGSYAGLVGKLEIEYTDGSKETIVTGKDGWKIETEAVQNWIDSDFDDSAWKAPDMAVNYGAAPWNSGVGLSAANDRAAVLLRKEFSLSGEVQEATVSVAGLGYFDLSVNGKSPDDSLLNCCNTQYSQTVLYRTFDITALLQSGSNALGVELGNSFYNEQGGVWNWGSAEWKDSPKLLLQMTVRYTDGKTETIVSDESWQVSTDGPITFNSIYYGETYDARKEMEGWQTVGFSADGWKNADKMDAPEGKLVCQLEDPVKRTEEFQVSDIKQLKDGSYVVYCPEMVAGWAALTFKNASAGDQIMIVYSEKLNSDGSVQKLGGSDGVSASWWPERYNMSDIYIAKGGESETYEPKFSYKGFRYIQIYGYTGALAVDDIKIYRVRNDVEVTGSFECSDQLLNDMHAMMVRTMMNNLQGKPTDTPVWEKNGWLGDLNVALDTFTYNFDFSNFLPNFVEIMEDCYNEYGLLPQMVPTANWGIADHYVWNSVFVFSVLRLYEVYGMTSYMSEEYSVLKSYAKKVIRAIQANKWVCPDGQLGDWVSPMGGKQNAQYNESPNEGSGIVGTAYVYGMLSAMVKIAEATGHESDVSTYTKAMSSIYDAFNEKFYNTRNGYYETTVWNNNGPQRTKFRQTSQLVALAFGLVPESNVQKVVDALVKDIEEKGNHLDTGCVGTKEILPILCEYGYAELAYKIATQTTYPSWGFMIEQGSTSLWEMWETTSRSLDHYFLGTYDEWFFEYLAGIGNIENGYESFTIHPFIPNDLSYVTCTEQTVRGKLESSWKKTEDGKVEMTVTIPYGSTAKIYFPTADAASVTLNGQTISESALVKESGSESGSAYALVGSGSYSFVSNYDQAFLPLGK